MSSLMILLTMMLAISRVCAQAPSPPRNLTLSAGANSIVLVWTAPADSGGAGRYITGYKLVCGPLNATVAQILVAASTTYEWTDVLPGTTYQCSCSALNNYGVLSAATPWSTVTTGAGAPSVPRNVTITGADTTCVNVTWMMPISAGGAGAILTGFRIKYVEVVNGVTSSTPTTISLPVATDASLCFNIHAGSTYSITVVARNSAGFFSSDSNLVTVMTAIGVPGSVSNVVTSVSTATISVQWAPPSDAGGVRAQVSNYSLCLYEIKALKSCLVVATTSAIFTSLETGTTYSVAIVVRNNAGSMSDASTVTAVTVCGPANTVERLIATSGSIAALELTWDTPTSVGGPSCTVSHYSVLLRATGTTLARNCSSSPCTVTDLLPGTRYSVSLCAISADGVAGASGDPVVVVSGLAPPSSVNITATHVLSHEIEVKWTVPLFAGGPDGTVSWYQVVIQNATFRQTLQTRECQQNFNDLEAGSVYTVLVTPFATSSDQVMGVEGETSRLLATTLNLLEVVVGTVRVGTSANVITIRRLNLLDQVANVMLTTTRPTSLETSYTLDAGVSSLSVKFAAVSAAGSELGITATAPGYEAVSIIVVVSPFYTDAVNSSSILLQHDSVSTTNAGGSFTFSISLQDFPVEVASATILCPITTTLDRAVRVDPDTLVFTSDNYLIPQFVSVTGVNTASQDNDATYFVRAGPLTSQSLELGGPWCEFQAINQNAHVAALKLSSPRLIDAQRRFVTVSLATPPRAPVVVPVSGMGVVAQTIVLTNITWLTGVDFSLSTSPVDVTIGPTRSDDVFYDGLIETIVESDEVGSLTTATATQSHSVVAIVASVVPIACILCMIIVMFAIRRSRKRRPTVEGAAVDVTPNKITMKPVTPSKSLAAYLDRGEHKEEDVSSDGAKENDVPEVFGNEDKMRTPPRLAPSAHDEDPAQEDEESSDINDKTPLKQQNRATGDVELHSPQIANFEFRESRTRVVQVSQNVPLSPPERMTNVRPERRLEPIVRQLIRSPDGRTSSPQTPARSDIPGSLATPLPKIISKKDPVAATAVKLGVSQFR